MSDYLQPVGKASRNFSIVGSTLTSIICLLLSVFLWTDMIQRHSFNDQGKPLWIAALAVGVIGCAGAFIAWRLVRRLTSGNGLTVMPIWFIQLSGALLLVGFSLVAYDRGSILFMVEGMCISLAMILVGRNISRRQNPRT